MAEDVGINLAGDQNMGELAGENREDLVVEDVDIGPAWAATADLGINLAGDQNMGELDGDEMEEVVVVVVVE